MPIDGLIVYHEEDFLMLSGLQHFLFCRRQWALIHIEKQWEENLRTIDGQLMHTRAHDESLFEKRGDIIITRGISVNSNRLGISGKCDVLEFHRDKHGISISDWEGLWRPMPVEYKRGNPKQDDCDAAQLCAQAMCLEEMLCCTITDGALFYGETKRRLLVEFTNELRQKVEGALEEMHAFFKRGHTPRVKRTKACNACSLKEICLPALMKERSVAAYMEESLCDDS